MLHILVQKAKNQTRLKRLLASFNQQSGTQVALIHLIVLATLISRRPQAIFQAQFWAEDGMIFFADQLRVGFWHAVIIPYAGYLHVVPRIVAGLLSFLEISRLPSAYGFCAITIATFCCAALSWPAFRWLISSDAVRFMACLVTAATIPAGSELIGSICDLNWFLPPVALLLLFTDWQSKTQPARKVTEAASCAALWIIGLTAPLLFVTIPLLISQLIRARGWKKWRAFALILALGIQFYVLMHAGSREEKHHVDFNSLLISTAVAGLSKGILGPLLGTHFLGAAGTANSIVTKLILTLILSVSLLTFLFVYLGNWQRRLILLTALYVCISAVAIAIVGRNLYSAFLDPSYIPLAEGHRYFLVPGLMFIFIAALATDRLLSVVELRSLQRMIPAAFPLVFSAGIIGNFRTPPLVDFSWGYYAAQIEEWQHMQDRNQPVADLIIPLNPPGFGMRLVSRNPR